MANKKLKNIKTIQINKAQSTLCRVLDIFVPRELTFELTRFCRVARASRLTCTQQTHCGMHASIFSHTQMITRVGILLYVRLESGDDRPGEEHMDLPIISSSFEMATVIKGLLK